MKNVFKQLKAAYNRWLNARRMARCIKEASKRLAHQKALWPGCEGARMMAWPTTGATGNGNAPTGQYIASGTATTILWGTNNWSSITGFLTVTKISQRTINAFKDQLPQGDGLTAGLVQGIDGLLTDIEVRDDTTQVVADLQVGKNLLIRDGGGLYPGGARGATYTGIITENGWDTAPRTPAGRVLTVEKFCLI